MGLINWRPLASVFADQVSKRQITPHSINTFLIGPEVQVASNGSLSLGTSLYSSKAMQFLALLLVVCYKNPIMIHTSPILSIASAR